MKRVLTLLLTALLLAALLLGCSAVGLKPITEPAGKTEPAKTDPGKSEPEKTEAPTEAPKTETPTEALETEPEKTEAPTEAPKTEPEKTEPVVYTSPCGTYKLKGINGMTLEEYFEEQFAEMLGPETGLTLETLLAMSGMSLDTLEEMMTITLNEDGTAVSTLREDDEVETVEGSWELQGDKIYITMEGDPAEFSYENGELIADMNGERMVFAR